MNFPETVLKIAAGEIGYMEKSRGAYQADPSILDEKTKGSGYDNYTKYGKEMHDIYPQIMDFPAPWCDAFVDWCFYKAYGTATAKSLIRGNFDDYTVASAQMFKKHGALDTTPKVGDQAFFTRNGQVSGCYHTGLVEAFDGTTLTLIEGNTSHGTSVIPNGGSVCRKWYTLALYKDRILFGHPPYDSKTATQSIVQPDTTKKPKALNTKPTYVAKVVRINTSLNVRTWAGTEYPNIKSWPRLYSGNMVDVCDVAYAADGSRWFYIRIMGQYYGFVSADYLQRV